jgi:hypothetical protein
MKCWNTVLFNVQGSRVIIVVVQVVEVRIRVAAVKTLRKKGRNSVYHEILWKKLVWVPVISFCEISFPIMHLMPYYAETGRSRPLVARRYG